MARCGLDDPLLAMQLFDEYVRPVFAYGVEVWGPQLIVRALDRGQADACERVHLDFLRQLLGARDTSPTLAVLAETGRYPTAVQWAVQTSRFVNRLVQMDDSRVAKQALIDNVLLAVSGRVWAGGDRRGLPRSLICLSCWAVQLPSARASCQGRWTRMA